MLLLRLVLMLLPLLSLLLFAPDHYRPLPLWARLK